MRHYDGKKQSGRIEAARAGKLDFKPYRKTTLTYAKQISEQFTVDTLEGLHTGKAGDYLAIGAHGEMYPIDKAVFHETYEPVEEVGE